MEFDRHWANKDHKCPFISYAYVRREEWKSHCSKAGVIQAIRRNKDDVRFVLYQLQEDRSYAPVDSTIVERHLSSGS